MAASLQTNLLPKLENDYIGINADVLNAVIAKAIKAYQTQELLKLQKFENGGGRRTYYLLKRPSKKCGFIYQARYIDPQTGKMLPTKYSTGTNDLNLAVQWAERNRKTCLERYKGKAELSVFEAYYVEGSKYLKYEGYDGRVLSPAVMKQRQAFTNNHIIPFFQGQKVRYLSQITPIHIKQLKNYLSTEKRLKPQTINYNLHSFKKCLEIMKDCGKITTDFSKCSFSVKGSKQAEKARGVYGMEALKGVFSKQWENGLSKLLCMVIYFTGIRNSEILRMRFNDLEKMQDVFFLNVRGTKSRNAVRKAPIHPTLYTALETYTRENGIAEDAPIFKGAYNDTFRRASFDMGSLLGYTEKELFEKGICFYSGRHTFKSFLSIAHADKAADIDINFQEMFMGHNFNKEELKKDGINEYQYKHLNCESIGNGLLVKKGREVLKVIDRYYL
jgi:site-specific recombinase XerD